MARLSGVKLTNYQDFIPNIEQLFELANAIEGCWQKDDYAKQALNICMAIMDADICSIYLVDWKSSLLNLYAHEGYKGKFKDKSIQYNLKRLNPEHKLGVTGHIGFSGNEFLANSHADFTNCPEYDGGNFDHLFHGKTNGNKIQSFYGVPLKVSNTIIGVLKVESYKENHFSQNKRHLLSIANSMISSSLYSSFIIEQIHDLYEKLGNVTKTGNNPYNLLAETCARLVAAEACTIFLINNSDRLVIRGDYGHKVSLVNDDSFEATYGPGEGQTWKTFEDDRPNSVKSNYEVETSEYRKNKIYEKQWDGEHTCYSWYQFPVGIGKVGSDTREKLGLMKVENKLGPNHQPIEDEGFSNQDESILQIFANTAIPLIANMRDQQSIADELQSLGLSSKFSFVSNISEIYEPKLLDELRDLKAVKFDGLHEAIVDFVGEVRQAHDRPLCDHISLTRRNVENIAKSLSLSKEIISYIAPLQSYQPVLFQLPEYREHFVHQFNVFLLGYVILNSLPAESFKLFENRCTGKQKDKAVFKVWFVVSLFHDTGYPLGKSGKWASDFLAQMFKLEMDDKFPNISETLAVRLMRNGANDWIKNLMQSLSKMISIGQDDLRKVNKRLLSNFFNLDSEDLIASLLVIAAAEKKDIPLWIAKEAASSIILHEIKLWKDIGIKIHLDYQPFAFLLQYCDAIQEYGRSKGGIKPSTLDEWKVNSIELDINEKTITATIKYSEKPSIWDDKVQPMIDENKKRYISNSQLIWSVRYYSEQKNSDFETLQYFKS
jgi:hypothetical protein